MMKPGAAPGGRQRGTPTCVKGRDLAHSREQDRETIRIALGLGLFVVLAVAVFGLGYILKVTTGLPLTSDWFGRSSMLVCATVVFVVLRRRGQRSKPNRITGGSPHS